MRAVLLATAPLLIGVALIMAGNGLQGSLLALRATLEGFPASVTGIIMSGYYAGFLFGSQLTPRIVERVGHVRVFAALAALASMAILIQAVFVYWESWTLFRALTGFCYSGLYVVIESWLNDRAANENRGRLLAFYTVIQAAAIASGQLMLNLDDPAGFQLFTLVAILISASVLPVLLVSAPMPRFGESRKLSLRTLYRLSPLGMIGTLGAGVTLSGFSGMGAVYARTIGFSVSEVSLYMALAVIGSAIFPWPLGWLADRFDRRRVITVLTTALALLCVAGLYLAEISRPGLLAVVFLYGGLSMPIYSLSVAHANDRLEPDQMVAASSSLMLAYGLGAILGPLTVGQAMVHLGPPGYFIYLASAHVLIGLFAVWRMIRRPS
ncbi:MFS transporter [Hypericibacter adhaerens]|jgi:MFS family permease|uniref:MFS transporter n=1 Tax=Hypericibacter adhaerens TaxID=2602016 RepID=A0A5J6N2A5_9PROT|nr:MFS transporter [Hypericibacter adhaerens]QEX23083.1 MFS transporter [Hypericibacter adhaerens]